MKKQVTGMVTVLLLATLFLTGCIENGGSPTPAQPPATIPQLQSEISTLRAQVSTLSGQVANLSNQLAGATGSTDTTALEQSITDLQSQVTVLANRIVELETEQGGGSGNTTEVQETTRWLVEAWADYEGYKLVGVEWSTPRIEEEDDYRIYLELFNKGIADYKVAEPTSPAIGELWLDSGKMKKCTWFDGNATNTTWTEAAMDDIYIPILIDMVTIAFRPKSGDRVRVDENNTYLDNLGKPYLDWETEVKTRNDGTCRKIWAETMRKFTLPVPDGFDGRPEYPYPYELRLEFELYYLA